MAPVKLMVKNSYDDDQLLEPFEVDGVEWIDGSVQADLPFERISTLFAVTSFIVSQTNFHIVPFINKNHHPNQKSMYWSLFQTMEWDIRNRALKLSRLGLFPRIFGQDISKVFKQKYHGNLTIVPRFTTMQTFGLKILSNPTVKDMEGYLKYSQIAVWPYLNVIRDMTRLEKSLDDCLARLEARMRALSPSDNADWSHSHYNDDVESIASVSATQQQQLSSSITTTRNVRIAADSNGGGGGGTNYYRRGSSSVDNDTNNNNSHYYLRERITGLEHENESLRKQLEQLQHHIAIANTSTNSSSSSSQKNERQKSNDVATPRTVTTKRNLDDDDDDIIHEVHHHSNMIVDEGDDETTNDDDGTKSPSLADGAEGFVWKHVVLTKTASTKKTKQQPTISSG